MVDLSEAIQLTQSTDIAQAGSGADFRFRQVAPFRLQFESGPHGDTLRQTIALSGDYIALASIFVLLLRVANPTASGLVQFYIRDETNAVVFSFLMKAFAAGESRHMAHFMPILFNTTVANKTFRLFTYDGSAGGVIYYDIAGFFAQI